MKRRGFIHSCLALVILVIPLASCGGVRLTSPAASIRDADRKFDAAEAFLVRADKGTEQETRREQVARKKALYDDAIDAYRAIIKAEPTGEYAQRSLWQISEIHRRRYEWDAVVENYSAIIDLAPSSYYGDRAKSGISDMRKYRGLIEEKRRRYQNYSALYAQNNAQENYDIAAQALFDVADSYEQLGDYPEAIAHYQRMVEEFSEHEKAPVALTKIGEINCYKLYDYQGGWYVSNKLIEMYPDTYDATKAVRLLKETSRHRKEIALNQAEIKPYQSRKAMEYEEDGRKILRSESYCVYYVDITVQCYQFIARRWEDLGNYPSAIVAYRRLVDELPHKRFAVADARYQIGRLYQLTGQLDQAIDAYQDLFDNHPESTWRAEAIYQQAVCYREIREFAKAYAGFKAYVSLSLDVKFYREAQRIIARFEMDEDGDGYKFYAEQEAGTSDQDCTDYPGAKS